MMPDSTSAVKVEPSEENKPQFDRLKMYFGLPFDVGNGMKIIIPTVGDILELENSDLTFYQTLYIWIANPTTYRLMLWDNKIDWNKISDYDLFLMLYKSENPEVSKMIFGDDIDFGKFSFFTKSGVDYDPDGNPVEKTEVTLYDPEDDIELSEKEYTLISSYLKAAFNIYPKVEKAKGKITKQSIIEEERMNLEARKRKGEDKQTSTLLPLVSACINHPGFKYNLEELKNVNFVQFMDSVQRLQIYENATALLKGSYSGMIDTSKINKEEFNWMKDLSNK